MYSYFFLLIVYGPYDAFLLIVYGAYSAVYGARLVVKTGIKEFE